MFNKEKLVDLMVQAGVDISKEDVKYDATFSELGLDSLDVFNFFSEIDAELGVDVPDEDFENLDNLNKTYEYISQKTSGR